MITLAVEDLPRAVQFYENMGWQAAQSGPGVAAFNMNGTVFGLYPWNSMAQDMGLDPKSVILNHFQPFSFTLHSNHSPLDVE